MANDNDRLGIAGRWVSVDKWQTEVAFEIESQDGIYSVRAIDEPDGEEAEIYDVKATGEHLTFAAHWSTGQFTKYRIRALGDQLEAVFTYTDTTHFTRRT
jgi:hypothetical protein